MSEDNSSIRNSSKYIRNSSKYIRNSSRYSLYYTLNTNIPQKKVDAKTKKELMKILGEIDEQKSEAVFLLIAEHFRITNKEKQLTLPYTVPYEGSINKNNVSFDLDKLPQDLVWILAKFLRV